MTLPQRKTTNRERGPRIKNIPYVEINEDDITDTMRVETPASDVLSALDEVKELWRSGRADYVVPVVHIDKGTEFFDSRYEYMIYTPEKEVTKDHSADKTVEEWIDLHKRIKGMGDSELEGVYIDTVRCPEDSHDIHIAKVVVRDS